MLLYIIRKKITNLKQKQLKDRRLTSNPSPNQTGFEA